MMKLVPEEKQKELEGKIVPNSNPNEFCMDGFQFASDLVFAMNRPEEAAELLAQYEAAEKEEPVVAEEKAEVAVVSPPEGMQASE